MIKNFQELYDLDISPFTSKKPTFKKDKATGQYKKVGELDYLSWADCLLLLHRNGAENVRFGNVRTRDDHPLFLCEGRAPFIRIYVDIDGDRRELDYPVIDGGTDITMEKLTQSDLHNATQRGFVKCVAVNWGLGLKHWQKEEREAPAAEPKDDLSIHNVLSVKRRIEELVTAKMQFGMTLKELCSNMGITEKQLTAILTGAENLYKLENKLRAL